jgi:hypothetical protein
MVALTRQFTGRRTGRRSRRGQALEREQRSEVWV